MVEYKKQNVLIAFTLIAGLVVLITSISVGTPRDIAYISIYGSMILMYLIGRDVVTGELK